MDSRGARPLALSEAIQIAVQQNLGIVLSREQAASTDQGIGIAMGSFELEEHLCNCAICLFA